MSSGSQVPTSVWTAVRVSAGSGRGLHGHRLVCHWHGLALDGTPYTGWSPPPVHDDGLLDWTRLDAVGGEEPLDARSDAVLGRRRQRPARQRARRALALVGCGRLVALAAHLGVFGWLVTSSHCTVGVAGAVAVIVVLKAAVVGVVALRRGRAPTVGCSSRTDGRRGARWRRQGSHWR